MTGVRSPTIYKKGRHATGGVTISARATRAFGISTWTISAFAITTAISAAVLLAGVRSPATPTSQGACSTSVAATFATHFQGSPAQIPPAQTPPAQSPSAAGSLSPSAPVELLDAVAGVMLAVAALPDVEDEETRQAGISSAFDALEGRAVRLHVIVSRVTDGPGGVILIEGTTRVPATFTRTTPWPPPPEVTGFGYRPIVSATSRSAGNAATREGNPSTRRNGDPSPAPSSTLPATQPAVAAPAVQTSVAEKPPVTRPVGRRPVAQRLGGRKRANPQSAAAVSKVLPAHTVIIATRDPNARLLPVGVPLPLTYPLQRIGFIESDSRTDMGAAPLVWPNRVFSSHSPGRTTDFALYLALGLPLPATDPDGNERIDRGIRLLDITARPGSDSRWAGLPFLGSNLRPEEPNVAWERVREGLTPAQVASVMGGHQSSIAIEGGGGAGGEAGAGGAGERRTWVFRDMTGETTYQVMFSPGAASRVTAFTAAWHARASTRPAATAPSPPPSHPVPSSPSPPPPPAPSPPRP